MTHDLQQPHSATSNTLSTEIVLPRVTGPEGLQVRQRHLPAPAAGQVLLRMEASGVSFAEQAMRRGRYPGQPKFPFVPGYDVVGIVEAVGVGVPDGLVGTRVAAAIKTGGWASRLLLPAADLVSVPPALDPALVEAVIVNGITAWQMLHRSARVRAGQTVLVHGGNGGVGTVLVQLARHAGVRVIATAAPRHHEALRALGAEPLDSRAPGLEARVRALVPQGVDAVFDHLGLASARRSFGLLARGGTLVMYGTAADLDSGGSVAGMFAAMLGQIALWTLLPNHRRVSFYNFWAGHSVHLAGFRRRLREDLGRVLELLDRGVIAPQIAARFPLDQAGQAMELAESRTVLGKVVITA